MASTVNGLAGVDSLAAQIENKLNTSAPVPDLIQPLGTVPVTSSLEPPAPVEPSTPPEPPPSLDPPTIDEALAALSTTPLPPEIKDEELESIGVEVSGKSASNPKTKFAIQAAVAFRTIAKPVAEGGLGLVPSAEDLTAWHRDSQLLSNLRDELDYSQDPSAAIINGILADSSGRFHQRTPEVLIGLTTQVARNPAFTPELRQAIAQPLMEAMAPDIRSQGAVDYVAQIRSWVDRIENKEWSDTLKWALTQITTNLPPTRTQGVSTPQPTPSPLADTSTPKPGAQDVWQSRYMDRVNRDFEDQIAGIARTSIDSLITRTLDLYQADLEKAFPNPAAREAWRARFASEIATQAESDTSVSRNLGPIYNRARSTYVQRSPSQAAGVIAQYQSTLDKVIPEVVRRVAPRFLQNIPQRPKTTTTQVSVPTPGGPGSGTLTQPLATQPGAGASGPVIHVNGSPTTPTANGPRWGMTTEQLASQVEKMVGDRFPSPIVPKR